MVSLPDDLINKILMFRDIHPVAVIYEKWYPVYSAKKEMEKSIENRDKCIERCNRFLYPLWDEITQIREECENTPECRVNLRNHLDICEYGCTLSYVSYDCDHVENGRCRHFYDIEYKKEDCENYEEQIERYSNCYDKDKFEYEYALAIAEDREREFLSYDSD